MNAARMAAQSDPDRNTNFKRRWTQPPLERDSLRLMPRSSWINFIDNSKGQIDSLSLRLLQLAKKLDRGANANANANANADADADAMPGHAEITGESVVPSPLRPALADLAHLPSFAIGPNKERNGAIVKVSYKPRIRQCPRASEAPHCRLANVEAFLSPLAAAFGGVFGVQLRAIERPADAALRMVIVRSLSTSKLGSPNRQTRQ